MKIMTLIVRNNLLYYVMICFISFLSVLTLFFFKEINIFIGLVVLVYLSLVFSKYIYIRSREYEKLQSFNDLDYSNSQRASTLATFGIWPSLFVMMITWLAVYYMVL